MTSPNATSEIQLDVNGERRLIQVEHRATLLDLLRDELDLTGAKRACDRGECGACTVLVDDEPVLACHLLAMQVRGKRVTTIEGLAGRPDFAPLLEAFVAEDAGQCGFCVPGFAVAAYAALREGSSPNPFALRWQLVGHICRCGAYDRIVAAAVRVAAEAPAAGGGPQ